MNGTQTAAPAGATCGKAFSDGHTCTATGTLEHLCSLDPEHNNGCACAPGCEVRRRKLARQEADIRAGEAPPAIPPEPMPPVSAMTAPAGVLTEVDRLRLNWLLAEVNGNVVGIREAELRLAVHLAQVDPTGLVTRLQNTIQQKAATRDRFNRALADARVDIAARYKLPGAGFAFDDETGALRVLPEDPKPK